MEPKVTHTGPRWWSGRRVTISVTESPSGVHPARMAR